MALIPNSQQTKDTTKYFPVSFPSLRTSELKLKSRKSYWYRAKTLIAMTEHFVA